MMHHYLCRPVSLGLIFTAGAFSHEEPALSAVIFLVGLCIHWLGRPWSPPVQLEILDHVVETTHLNPVVRQAARRALQEIRECQ